MYPGLQAARGAAALLVVFFHADLSSEAFYGRAFDGIWGFGHIGVDFFFVLSGFIIYHAHRRDSAGYPDWRRYFTKRIIRIYPAFLPISVLMLAFYQQLGSVALVDREIGVLPSLLLIPSSGGGPALAVSWTLMHEMLFYCVFSIRFFGRRVFLLVVLLWAAAILLHTSAAADHFLVAFLLSTYNLEFLMGITVSWLVANFDAGNRVILAAGLTGFGCYAGMSYLAPGVIAQQAQLVQTLYLGVSFSLIVWGLCYLDRRHAPAYPGWVLFLGAASYSIYLIHDPAISVLNRIAARLETVVSVPADLVFLGVVSLATLAGITYHLIVERPSLRVLRGRWLQ